MTTEKEIVVTSAGNASRGSNPIGRNYAAGIAKATRKHKFELKRDGSVERVGFLGAYGPTVEAGTKSEAIAKLLAFAYRAAEHTPQVKIRNGAYQLAFESVAYGVTVETGVESRKGALCISGEADWKSVTDETASFRYYASAEYQQTAHAASL